MLFCFSECISRTFAPFVCVYFYCTPRSSHATSCIERTRQVTKLVVWIKRSWTLGDPSFSYVMRMKSIESLTLLPKTQLNSTLLSSSFSCIMASNALSRSSLRKRMATCGTGNATKPLLQNRFN